MKQFRKLNLGRIFVFLGLLIASISFVRCKPIAPSILKNRYLREGGKATIGSSSPQAIERLVVVTKTLDDKKTFESEISKFSEGQKLVLSEHVRSDAFDEIKDNGFAEIHAGFAAGESLTALVFVEPTDDDQALVFGEVPTLVSQFSLELRSIGSSTWVLAVSSGVNPKASSWNRNRLIQIVLVSNTAIRLPESDSNN
ncbi:MAG: hypothetical protein AABZ55_13390 [Bdellovibrionota bacterium]